ncbi:MAG: BatA domain-containing protein, partial [Planctomycetales bacterium]
MFANPWGLLGLISLPAIVAIHLYHRRFPPLVIAGAHLWGAETDVREAGRRRDRLPLTATLLLELLAALLLTLVLARPTFGDREAVQHLVVVLDDSASMSARPPGGASFRDRAAAELADRAEQLGRDAVFTLLLTGRRGVLGGSAISWAKAQGALAEWQPSAPGHDFAPAWDYAARIADQTGGTILFLTDHPPPRDAQLPERMEVVAVGESLENVALTAARWTFDSTAAQGRVFLRASNLGLKPAAVAITGTAKNQTVFERRETIPPGSAVPLELDVPGGLGELRIDLNSAEDGLALDDSATLIEPKVRQVTVAVTLPADDPARPLVDRALAGLPDVQPGPADEAHLLIGPAGELPPSRRDLWWLGIGPLDRSEEARKNAANLAGGYLLEKQHPLLAGVAFANEVWAGAQPVDLDVYPLIRAGEHVLLGRLQGTETTGYLLNIDLAQSHLPRTPNWPVLMSNLVELRRDALPGLRRWNYRIQEPLQFRAPVAEFARIPPAGETSEAERPRAEFLRTQLRLVEGDRTTPLAVEADGMVVVERLERPGVREIRAGDELLDRFAVNFFDPAESTLSRLRSETLPAPGEPPLPSLRPDDPFTWLLIGGVLLILLAVFFDWAV